MTYSILARDPATGELGGAVQSAWFSSREVLSVEAGLGAVASQAISEPAFGHLGVEMLRIGSEPAQVIEALTAADATPSIRQIGVLDLTSTPAAFSGADCVPDAEHQVGADCVAQANMMTNPGVPLAMVDTFGTTRGSLADRLLAALDAAQAIGGDFRGMQSAGLVVRAGPRGGPSWQTTVVDVRVDDHLEPLAELRRLADVSRAYRHWGDALERLAAGDAAGAVVMAREWASRLGDDPNIRLRLALTLIASGDPEGAHIVAAMPGSSDKWLAYLRGLCVLYHINPEPIFAALP